MPRSLFSGDFTFSFFSGNEDGKFQAVTDNADPTIVHILVLNSLDREATASYSLVLYATDTGGDIGKLYNVCKIWWLSKVSFLFFSEL